MLIGKLKGDDSYKFHENEGSVGVAILLIRTGLWCAFLVLVRRQQHAPHASLKIQAFYTKFSFAASLYLLAYPVLYLVTMAFAPYIRHKVITNGLFVMQLASTWWLSRIFLERGDYFQVGR